MLDKHEESLMFDYKLSPVTAWNKTSSALVAIAILVLITCDRRPDDTSIQVALAAGVVGLFAVIDLSVNRTWNHPILLGSSWLLPGLAVIFLATCTLSAALSGDSRRTLDVMTDAWALFVAWLALRIWTDRQPLIIVLTLLRCVCLSILTLSALLFSEIASNQYIHDYLVNSLGMNMSIPNYYIVSETHINVSPQFLAQHAASLSYLFWPILFAIYLSFGKWKMLCTAVFTLLTAYSVFYSINETAMLALALGVVAFIAAIMLPRISIAITAAGFILAVLAIVPLAYVAHDVLQLQTNAHIPPSGQARFPIWYSVANAVGERPLFGHGVVHLQALLHSGQGFIWEHAHSHNVFLQTWYELGAFGSAIMLLAGLVFLRLLNELPSRFVCFGVGGFVTVTINLITTAWELWVPWHLGLLTLVAMIVTLLNRVVADGRTIETNGT